ncbi:LOW QUALITY PROTEIN: lipase 1 [Drosophila albomicans]|uniref:LOW QUALITY PROTEIN: lipase 1 n=1 Tax=Drosophila albomicans TaxID=7291 RepID=A0A6P8W5T7_DROAB|nr:LOW QUALITY PROTEIN: lipase 1 [Drosophila albomicans]
MFGLLCLSLCWTASKAGYMEDNFPASVIEDGTLTTLQLLAKYKYPGEEHTVTTEDKYLLHVHRIPRPGAKPVLLVHGLQDASSTWIMMGPHSGLGYFLYDNGYDVWMANVRGNRYSRGHLKLNANTDKSYWSFSWHEIGFYDLPATIDAILAKTGYSKLSYIGHSQGTTSFFVMASTRPEYNDKVHVMQALAPVAFMTHVKAPLISVARSSMNILGDNFEVLPHSSLPTTQCMSSAIHLQTCFYYIWLILGKNPGELNRTMTPVLMGQLPAGANSKQVRHYLQLQPTTRFGQYDYGTDNQRIYGRATPPDYPLERITAPVGLYYAQNDYLSAVEDVQRLAKRLPNVVVNHLYANKKFNHVYMVWGISSRRLAQPKFLEVMRLWEAGGPQNGTATTTEIMPTTTEDTEVTEEEDIPTEPTEMEQPTTEQSEMEQPSTDHSDMEQTEQASTEKSDAEQPEMEKSETEQPDIEENYAK